MRTMSAGEARRAMAAMERDSKSRSSLGTWLKRGGVAAAVLAFLFLGDEGSPAFVVDRDEAEKVLGDDAQPVLQAAHDALAAVDQWTTAAIEEALRAALIDGLGLKPKVAFSAVRTAVTGRRVSPPLFESMAILGRESSLARLRGARTG